MAYLNEAGFNMFEPNDKGVVVHGEVGDVDVPLAESMLEEVQAFANGANGAIVACSPLRTCGRVDRAVAASVLQVTHASWLAIYELAHAVGRTVIWTLNG